MSTVNEIIEHLLWAVEHSNYAGGSIAKRQAKAELNELITEAYKKGHLDGAINVYNHTPVSDMLTEGWKPGAGHSEAQ